MSSVETTGVRTVEVPDLAALTMELKRIRGEVALTADKVPNVVQCVADGHSWSQLREHGLLIRPTWLHWVTRTGEGSTGLIARQTRSQRQRSRQAMRGLEHLRMEIVDPIEAAVYDEWVALYDAQVADMRLGHNFATEYRAGMVQPDSGFLMVVWREHGDVVGGVIVRHDPERSSLVARFGAVAPSAKRREVPRAMYLTLVDVAAERGLPWLSLGNDINFYGAMCRPGLCAFKLRLGFRPVPADFYGNNSTRTVAEQVVSLDGLEPPVLRFEYQATRHPDTCLDDFVDGSHDLRLVSLIASGQSNAILESLPPHRRLVLLD